MYHAEFPARHDAFHRVRTFVEDACERAGIQRADCLRLTLVVEELFVNTVVHGHGGDTDAPIRLALTVTPAAIAVRYEDTAQAFDPLAVPDEPDAEDDLDQRPIGGLGVRLIRAIAQDLHYASGEGWNQLTFRVARSSGG